ncbi:MAG: hypothetical protein HYT93_00895 [Parcubacteria group bacterium]|nr:hypothetical protein [Parcubacteria group bacterium]
MNILIRSCLLVSFLLFSPSLAFVGESPLLPSNDADVYPAIYKAHAKMLQFPNTQIAWVEFTVRADGRWFLDEISGDGEHYWIAAGNSWKPGPAVTKFPDLKEPRESLLLYCVAGRLDSAVGDLSKGGFLLIGSAIVLHSNNLGRQANRVGFFRNEGGDWIVIQTEPLMDPESETGGEIKMRSCAVAAGHNWEKFSY